MVDVSRREAGLSHRPLGDFRAESHRGLHVEGVLLGEVVVVIEPFERRRSAAALDARVFEHGQQALVVAAEHLTKEASRQGPGVFLRDGVRRNGGGEGRQSCRHGVTTSVPVMPFLACPSTWHMNW